MIHRVLRFDSGRKCGHGSWAVKRGETRKFRYRIDLEKKHEKGYDVQ